MVESEAKEEPVSAKSTDDPKKKRERKNSGVQDGDAGKKRCKFLKNETNAKVKVKQQREASSHRASVKNNQQS